MRDRLRKAASLMGNPRLLVTSCTLVVVLVGVSMTSGAIAGGKPLTPYMAATSVGLRSTPPGAPSAAGIQYISVGAGIAGRNGGSAHGTATCPAGYYVIGGGLASLGSNIAVSEDAPNPDHTSWSVVIQNNDYSSMPLNVYAICVGSAGLPGSPGLANPQYISASGGIAAANGGDAHMSINCPDGTNVIGGGFAGLGSNIAVSEDAPNPDHLGWSVEIQNNDHTASPLNVYAICAAVG